jgi:hypothetical protein
MVQFVEQKVVSFFAFENGWCRWLALAKVVAVPRSLGRDDSNFFAATTNDHNDI